jgi:hypothetical protein
MFEFYIPNAKCKSFFLETEIFFEKSALVFFETTVANLNQNPYFCRQVWKM